MNLQDCDKYASYSGEHLVCEIQNEQLKANFWDGVALGGLFFFIVGLALMWFICWCEKKQQEMDRKRPY